MSSISALHRAVAPLHFQGLMAVPAVEGRSNQQWVADLQAEGPARDAALADLRRILVNGLRHGLLRRVRGTGTEFDSQAEDFVQEALLKVLDQLASFRDESRFTTWAHKIAIRVALTELRRKRWRDVSLDALVTSSQGTRAVAFPDAAPGPAQAAGKKAVLALLHRYIDRELTPKQRQALLAVGIYGMPLEEVARRMGSTRNALYKLLHDARRRLKRKLLADGFTAEHLLEVFR